MNNYDIVIVAHEKDFNNIKFIVEHSNKNLNFDSIHLILSEREEYRDMDLLKTLTEKPIFLHKESDVLKIDKSRISYRPNWIYQMLLKMLQNVTDNDNYLIIEADCLILKNINFFEDDKTIFYLNRDQNNEPYYNFSNKILGVGREYNHSFISEFMMYDKKKIKDMISKANCNNNNDFLELIYNNIKNDSYLADYEIYGNFCYKYYPDEFKVSNSNSGWYARYSYEQPFWRDHEIQNLINNSQDKDSISFHTFMGGVGDN